MVGGSGGPSQLPGMMPPPGPNMMMRPPMMGGLPPRMMMGGPGMMMPPPGMGMNPMFRMPIPNNQEDNLSLKNNIKIEVNDQSIQ